MSITKKEVEHIARLSRIALEEKDLERFAGDLSAILGFVEKLNEVDTSGIPPLAGMTELKNQTRPDEQLDLSLESKQAEMLAQSPAKKEEWIKVKAVFE